MLISSIRPALLEAGLAAALVVSTAASIANAQPAPAHPPAGSPGAAPKPHASAKPETPRIPPPVQPKKAAKPEPLPPLDTVRLWLIAPTARGIWTLRIDNEGNLPVRIPADARLLRLEIETPDGKRVKKTKCTPPEGLRSSTFPEARALVLAPGQSYIEEFDPALICFGKDAVALEGGSLVRARFGWDPPPKHAKKPPEPPFAAEALEEPRTHAPLRELLAPSMILSWAVPPPPTPSKPAKAQGDRADAFKPDANKPDATAPDAIKPDGARPETAEPDAPKPEAPKPEAPRPEGPPADAKLATEPSSPAKSEPAIEDPHAPRLRIVANPWGGGTTPRTASVTATVENAGGRPMTVALRSRMLAFEIAGPDGTVVCEASQPTHAVPRDMYRTLKPGAKTSFTVLLEEACPEGALLRAGIYRVWPSIVANEPGTELGLTAFTGKARAESPAVLRIVTAREPYHASPPKAVPTPRPSFDPDP